MPYRGMRLMDVSVERLEKVLKVRLALEQLAAEDVRLALQKDPDIIAPLVTTADLMMAAAHRGDRYEIARLDTIFHRQLCGLTGNEVLLRTWEPLSLQLTIIFGLSAMQKDLVPSPPSTPRSSRPCARRTPAARRPDARAYRRLHPRPRPRGLHPPTPGRGRGRVNAGALARRAAPVCVDTIV